MPMHTLIHTKPTASGARPNREVNWKAGINDGAKRGRRACYHEQGRQNREVPSAAQTDPLAPRDCFGPGTPPRLSPEEE